MIRIGGLDFHVEVEGRGPPLLLLHGFSGSAHTWDQLRATLSETATLIVVDLIGHARSAAPADAARYSLPCAADDLLGIMRALGQEQADVLGYSMGGRLALHFAVSYPDRVRRLILESASPGIADDAERQRRAAADAALADRLERDGLEAFVAEWERQPLLRLGDHVSPVVRAAQRAERLAHSPRGLANSLRGMGTGRQTPLWAALPRLNVPVTLIVGERDQRYVAIAERMHADLPRSSLHVLAAAGHTVHLDQPLPFAVVMQQVLTSN